MQQTAVSQDPRLIQPESSINPDVVYPESFSAKVLNISLPHHRLLRRRDEAEGTPGRRTPIPIRVTERRIGFQGKAILRFLSEREHSQPAPFRNDE
ncbi:MAG: hypothetical protein R3F54_18495 [Alphaproteobacteria bacterium]